MQPQIDLELVASPHCLLLSREQDYTFCVKFCLRHREPITIATPGTLFDPAAAFAQGRIEVIDAASGEKVNFLRENSTGEDSLTETSLLFLLPGKAGALRWSTVSAEKQQVNLFDISGLSPHRKYVISFHDLGLTDWFPGTQEKQRELQPNVGLDAKSESISVNLLGKPPTFSTRPALPPAPPVSVSVWTSAPTCSLSGEPPFTVFVNWKLGNDHPISALMIQSLLVRNIGIEIRDPERRRRRLGPHPEWLECGDEEPPKTVELLRLSRSVLFQQSYTLSAKPKLKGLVSADTRNLVSGNTYEITLREMNWRWLYDNQLPDAVLKDKEKLKEALWQEPTVQFRPECKIEFCAE